MSQNTDFNMKFEDFLNIYYDDIRPRIRENTMRTKKYIIDLKILPYFANKTMNEIKPSDIRKWQNELMAKGYSDTYLRTVNNQLTAIFNFATKYHDLKNNPCTKAGSIGKNHANEMNFWTKEEFAKFIDAVMDKHCSYMGFNYCFGQACELGNYWLLPLQILALRRKPLLFQNPISD